MSKHKLETVYPVERPDSALAAYIGGLIESLPMEQRLYPDLFANDLAKKIVAFLDERTKGRVIP